MRGLIRGTGGFKRGTQAAMEAAAAPYLIGQQRLDFQERQGGAYRLTVSSYASETPDSAAVLAALISQKPAGILLTYNVLGGQTYTDVKRKHATYQNARDTYANYLDMRSTAP